MGLITIPLLVVAFRVLGCGFKQFCGSELMAGGHGAILSGGPLGVGAPKRLLPTPSLCLCFLIQGSDVHCRV